MSSRFVNLLVKRMNGREAPFSLLRINPANLFYPTGSPVPRHQVGVESMEDVPLPPSTISFECPATPGISHDLPYQHYPLNFMAFGRNRDKIVGVDSIARTFLYDAASRCIRTSMPEMPHGVTKPVCVPVGDNGIFVMSATRPQFAALLHGPSANSSPSSRRWQSLPQPPFPSRSSQISAYTVVGDSQIWVSTFSAGTYTFDAESDAWSKAGDWALPFRGRAEHVPEHNLWFGFTGNDEHLCASDLTAVSTARPPVPLQLWRDLVWPEDWKFRTTHLLPLGSGKFCIARFFLTSEE
ncbi:hypothetical protein ACQ4PT_056370 [Festuca glaucescens]